MEFCKHATCTCITARAAMALAKDPHYNGGPTRRKTHPRKPNRLESDFSSFHLLRVAKLRKPVMTPGAHLGVAIFAY
jgi:hypothetical protein